MANGLAKNELVLFERILMGFNPNNITANQVSKYMAPPMQFERAGLTVHRPIPYISTTTSGLTITPEDKTQLTVPSSLNTTTNIINVPFQMNAVELNDPQQRDRIVQSALIALSAKVDNVIARKVAQQGTLFVADSAALTTYSQVTKAESAMTLRDVPIMHPRSLILNANDYNALSGNLAQRDSTPLGVSLTAFERSKIPMIGTFDSFKASFMPGITAAAGSGITINGAGQRYIPVSIDANGNNVDHRYQTITVNNTTDVAVGDAFTIAGVNALSMIHKNDTQEAQTFRVISVDSGTTMTISPAIVVSDGATEQSETDYANCSAVPANGAAITFLNTQPALSNIFFANDSVEIIHGDLSSLELDGSSGVASQVESTDSGIQILFAKGSSVNNLQTTYRLTMWMDATVLNPMMCGNLVGGQT